MTERRADYSRLKPLLTATKKSKKLQPLLVVTGAHLLKKFGRTIDIIKKDGFKIAAALPIMNENDPDTPEAMAKSFGKAVIGMVGIVGRLKPDIVVAGFDLGGNLAAAITAMHMNTCVAHLEGGGVSGGIDDTLRHAITKFSHIHFPASEEARRRIIGLGENPKYVFNVGSLSMDTVKNIKYLPRSVVFKKFNLDPAKKLILFLQHPVTTEEKFAARQINESITALKLSEKKFNAQILAILGNSDAGGRRMMKELKKSGIKFLPHIPYEDFLRLMKVTDALLGNSSAGIQEAPFFGLPVVNVGSRQRFRERGINVIDAPHNSSVIVSAIRKSLFDKKFIAKAAFGKNPYEGGDAAKRIIRILETIKLPPIQKVMHEA